MQGLTLPVCELDDLIKFENFGSLFPGPHNEGTGKELALSSEDAYQVPEGEYSDRV